MNEFDFQNADFLDNLFTSSSYASEQIPLAQETSQIPATTSYSQNTTADSTFSFNSPAFTSAEAKSSASVTSSQSFPPNFYTEITYEDDNVKESEETNGVPNSNVPTSQNVETPTEEESQLHEPEIDIAINNVVCSFAVRCHLNLRKVAMEGTNVIYKRENGMVSMKLRNPHTTASLWSSGKITCTGATSEVDAKRAARRICRILQKMEFRVKLSNFRVVNVLGTCSLPFGIRITQFSADHKEASYEPELHPGVTYRIKQPKATLKIFSTGSITVTAPSVNNVQLAIEYIYPLVSKYRMEKQKTRSVEVIDSKMHFMPTHRGRPGPMRHRRGHDQSDLDSDEDTDTSEDDY